MSEIEIWKPVKGYENLYEVSNLGRVKSIRNGDKILKTYLSTYGYVKVNLYAAKKSKIHFLHRVIALAFIENPEAKPIINHKNGIKHDNSLENIEWVTYSENSLHAIKTGLRSHDKRLSPQARQEINQSDLSPKEICEKYNIGMCTFYEIKRRSLSSLLPKYKF